MKQWGQTPVFQNHKNEMKQWGQTPVFQNHKNETMGSDPGVSKSAFHLPLSTQKTMHSLAASALFLAK